MNIIQFLKLCQSSKQTKMYPPFALIIISLIRSDIVHRFICLPAIYISSYVNCFKGSVNSLVKLDPLEDAQGPKLVP